MATETPDVSELSPENRFMVAIGDASMAALNDGMNPTTIVGCIERMKLVLLMASDPALNRTLTSAITTMVAEREQQKAR